VWGKRQRLRLRLRLRQRFKDKIQKSQDKSWGCGGISEETNHLSGYIPY
jgi:hypothetical protein